VREPVAEILRCGTPTKPRTLRSGLFSARAPKRRCGLQRTVTIDLDQGAGHQSSRKDSDPACRAAQRKGDVIVRRPIAMLALRLLMAAGLCSLLALPAAAHPGHRHDRSAISAGVGLEKLVQQIAFDERYQEEDAVTTSVEAFGFEACCGQNETLMGSGCSSAMTCTCVSYGHGGALALSYGADLLLCPSGKVVALRQQVLAGLDPASWQLAPRPTQSRAASVSRPETRRSVVRSRFISWHWLSTRR